MDKAQALHKFWSGFGWKAYDEQTVPDKAELPYITYEVSTGKLDDEIGLSASLWFRSASWEEITKKSDEIANAIGFGKIIDIDEGRMWLRQGMPFTQRMAGSGADVRRILLNITVEFMTKF